MIRGSTELRKTMIHGLTELSTYERRQLTGKMPSKLRLKYIERDQESAIWHCATRLYERYGVREEKAYALVFDHLRIIRTDPMREKMVLYRRNESHIYRIEYEGVVYYPVLHPGRVSGRHIIITYLSEEMVWGNMMGEVTKALDNQHTRDDAALDFADNDPDNIA